jgi:hypothetical protein
MLIGIFHGLIGEFSMFYRLARALYRDFCIFFQLAGLIGNIFAVQRAKMPFFVFPD